MGIMEEFRVAIIISNSNSRDLARLCLSYIGHPTALFIFETISETATISPQDLGFQSVAGDIILRIFDEEPARRYNALVTEKWGGAIRDGVDSRVPPSGGDYSAQVPKAVGINHSMPWGKVEHFQAHGQDDPCDDHTRPSRPGLEMLLVSDDTEARPHHILDNTNCNVRCHIVRVIPRPEGEIGNMQRIEQDTDCCPQTTQGGTVRGVLQIQTQDSDHGQVQTVQDAGACAPVIELLSDRKIPGVEDHAKGPTSQSKVPKRHIVFPERVPGRDRFLDSRHAMPMRREIEEGEEHRKGLLHPQHPAEGPFTMELNHRAQHWGVSRNSFIGDNMLAGIIAFGWAGP